jgi:molybdopterin synthase catalytic subunit
MVEITQSRIDVQRIIGFVSTPESGGIDVFIGTTRNHSAGRGVLSLSYEAYEPMAMKIMTLLEQEAMARWPLHRVAIVHRLGTVDLTEASVVIAVSAAHRDEAFEACRFLIDRLKKDVPIWKKEHFADGTTEWSGVPTSTGERAEVAR